MKKRHPASYDRRKCPKCGGFVIRSKPMRTKTGSTIWKTVTPTCKVCGWVDLGTSDPPQIIMPDAFED